MKFKIFTAAVSFFTAALLLTAAAFPALAQDKAAWKEKLRQAKEANAQKAAQIKEKIEQYKAANSEKAAQFKQNLQQKIQARAAAKENAAAAEGGSAGSGGKLEELREKWKSNPKIQEFMQKLAGMNKTGEVKGPDAWKRKLAEIKEKWASLSAEDRSQLKAAQPSLSGKLESLEKNGWNIQGSWTGPKGNTGTYLETISKEAGAWNASGTWTGQDGKTLTGQTKTTVSGNTASFESAYTGEKGKQTTVSGTHTYDGKNTVETNKTVTGPGGNSQNFEGTTTFGKDGIRSEWTGESGKTYANEISSEKGADGKTVTTSTWTGPDGKTASSTGEVTFKKN